MLQQKQTQRGQVLLGVVILFTAIALTTTLGLMSPIVRQIQIAADYQSSQQSYYTADAGAEDVYYRIRKNIPVTFPVTLGLAGATTTITRVQVNDGEQQIFSQATARNLYRTIFKDLVATNTNPQFNYGVQVGTGGITMTNTAYVTGNVYSGGSVTGSNNNVVYGSVVSTGGTGLISGVHATGSAYAHTIQNSTIDQNAYYQTISNTTVSGTRYPGSADQPPLSMPISDATLDQWETTAANGGTIASPCPYQLNSGGTVTLGPVKIACDMSVSNGTTLNLTGSVWVAGNITLQNNVQVSIDPSLGNSTVAVIADNQANRLTSGIVNAQNSANFSGNGNNSYVMLISRNNSAENGGSTTAINISNSVAGNLLLYASHGQILLHNNITLTEVTAYQLALQNSANVIYTLGTAQPIFNTGPGGSWSLSRWVESLPQ